MKKIILLIFQFSFFFSTLFCKFLPSSFHLTKGGLKRILVEWSWTRQSEAFAQSTAIIGTGTATNSPYGYPAPYGNWYYGAKHQILIRASEMTAAGMVAGNITALAFQISTPAGTPLQGFTIRMKTTSATTVSSVFDNTGFVTVYGPQTYTDVTGWNTHTFSTPFAWNGTSNIIIETCFYNPSGYTQNAQMRYTSTSYNSVVYYYQDANPNICNQSSGYTSLNRPNIRLSYVPNGPPTAQFTANPTATAQVQCILPTNRFMGSLPGIGTLAMAEHPRSRIQYTLTPQAEYILLRLL